MRRTIQFVLLAVGVIALIVLVVEIVLSISATSHGDTPARVVHTTAGPYQLTVSLYKDPANAGFALPFAIAPDQPVQGQLSYKVESIPHTAAKATPVTASLSPDPHIANGVQGAAEITVQGSWDLEITVTDATNSYKVAVPITATAPPPLPLWIGWPLGFIPLIALIVFLLMLRRGKEPGLPGVESENQPDEIAVPSS